MQLTHRLSFLDSYGTSKQDKIKRNSIIQPYENDLDRKINKSRIFMEKFNFTKFEEYGANKFWLLNS